MIILLWSCVVFLLLPTFFVALECFFSLLPRQGRKSVRVARRPALAVLIPAHNESTVIADSLASIIPQLAEGDRLLVVADNCTDDTVEAACIAGAEVIVRQDEKNRGKGFALAYGLDELRRSPPSIVIIIDADCIVEKGSLDALAYSAAGLNRPVQALNLMQAKPQAALKVKVAEFAWVVKNRVRPLGLSRFSLPCQLMGTGMAFPWGIIGKMELANDSTVEDMQLGIELALQGYPTYFCPDACVRSFFPTTDKDLGTQRRRWEHGHINMICTYVPRLFLQALRKRAIGLLVLGLDLAVPPLALQSMLLLVGLGVTLGVAFYASTTPFIVVLSGCLTFGTALFLVWYKFARTVIGFRELMSIPVYIVSKLPVYVSYLFSRNTKWIKTGRGTVDK